MLNIDLVADLLRRSTLGDREALERRGQTPRTVVAAVLVTVHATGVKDRGRSPGRGRGRRRRRRVR